MKSIQLTNVAHYHGALAADAYVRGDFDSYTRHIAIHDRLLMKAGLAINQFAA